MSDELVKARAASRAAALKEALADSRRPCDCIDCDGFWCVWCFEHHGKKPCPFVEAIRVEA